MKDAGTSEARIDHEEADRLLPWYANGTLAPSEQLRVASHLSTCESCRRALAQFQRVQVNWQHQPLPAIDLEAGLARLMGAIEPKSQLGRPSSTSPTADPSAGSPRLRRSSRFRQWLSGQLEAPAVGKLGLALASVAGAAAIALVTLRAWYPAESPAFRTLGRSEPTLSTSGTDLRVVFAPSASIQQIAEVIASVNGRIVDGPTEMGVFMIRLETATSNPQGGSEGVERLRASPTVVLVEPVLAADH